MADAHALLGSATHTEAWQDLPWKKFQKVVFRLQKRIYQAACRGDRRKVHKLQRLLFHSRAARLLAVRKVTQENRGKKTPGVDGVASLTPKQRLDLVEDMRDIQRKPHPVRRVYIPKANGERRPLGISTMRDRALQSWVKLALEPEWEARFEPNVYGFRPGRSVHDAINAVFVSISQRPKYALDADIEKCYDRIEHRYLLNKLDTLGEFRRLIKGWLRAGMFDGQTWVPSTRGLPQGGPLSPLLMNVALDGLEKMVRQSVPPHKDGVSWLPLVTRYADDLIILHRDLETLQTLKQQTEAWLAPIGLRLKPDKTRITHTLEPYQGAVGFDFLGFEIRQYNVGKHRSGKLGRTGKRLGFKTIIKPSKEAQKRHLRKTGAVIKRYRGATQEQLIQVLEPIIRGWCNYYRHVVSKAVFGKMYHRVHHQLYKWAKWRHSNKGPRWRRHRYWSRVAGRMVFGRECHLNPHTQTKIVRHAKVIGRKSPYDGDWAYWGKRLSRYADLSPMKRKLLERQDGKCRACGLCFSMVDVVELHHKDKNRDNFALSNLALLHGHCHDTVHGTRARGRRRRGAV